MFDARTHWHIPEDVLINSSFFELHMAISQSIGRSLAVLRCESVLRIQGMAECLQARGKPAGAVDAAPSTATPQSKRGRPQRRPLSASGGNAAMLDALLSPSPERSGSPAAMVPPPRSRTDGGRVKRKRKRRSSSGDYSAGGASASEGTDAEASDGGADDDSATAAGSVDEPDGSVVADSGDDGDGGDGSDAAVAKPRRIAQPPRRRAPRGRVPGRGKVPKPPPFAALGNFETAKSGPLPGGVLPSASVLLSLPSFAAPLW